MWGVGEPGDILADPGQALRIVFGSVVRNGTDRGMRRGTAQRFVIHHLSRRAFDQIRSAQSHERRAVHHENHVRQRRQIRAARDARTHDGGDLGHLEIAAHDRVVVEDPGRTILTREDAALIRQVHTRRVDQLDDRDALAHCGLLRAQDLLDRLGPPGARLHRGVICDDDDGATTDAAQPGDDARRRRLAVVLVPGDQQSDLDPGAVLVEQRRHALARGQLPLIVLTLDALGAAPLLEAGRAGLVLFAECLEATHAATCSAAHSWMHLIRSAVGVPGPKSLPVPWDSSALMSSGGMMPPPVRSTSCRPAASSSLRTRGNRVMCAPDRMERPTTSTSSWIAAWAIISGVWCRPV